MTGKQHKNQLTELHCRVIHLIRLSAYFSFFSPVVCFYVIDPNEYGVVRQERTARREKLILTWTWNIVIESSSICTRTASFLPPPMLTSVAPSTPDGVLSECVIRLAGNPFEVWPSEFSDMFN